ncbi:MAG: FHA domain-containing protein [Luteitalea sp.]|nr:FHA domain-containing protein [Luteitalea sp.]
MSLSVHTPDPRTVPALRVHTSDGRTFRFSEPFHVGREYDCEVQIEDVHVSRKHLLVSFDRGRWWCQDLQSANGLFVNGRQVTTAAIEESVTVSLGADGPSLTIALERPAVPTQGTGAPPETVQRSSSDTRLLASYEARYFGSGKSAEPVGARTLMIRKAFQNVQKKQKRRYGWIVAVMGLAGLTAAGYAYYKHRQVGQQEAVAQELFYAMKSLDVGMADLERQVAESGSAQGKAQVKRYLARRRQMEGTYDRYLSVLNLYDQRLSEEDRLILRVTRLFGECELAAPPDYLRQVKSYIQKWKSSGRYARSVKLAQEMGYTKTIADEFLAQNLPPQFLYLAMQESDFNVFASGPPTRMGIAKGMWQFIPTTATQYGLTVGPLAQARKPDAEDDRHHWQKATRAAAHYIKDIYSTDAQASGLLVMASYNWGENRVIKLLRSMPENPAERNFWEVLEKHRNRVPRETYDYVFYIVSAAVIGENPRLFGFPFDNPLGFLEKG